MFYFYIWWVNNTYQSTVAAHQIVEPNAVPFTPILGSRPTKITFG
jgi:hypothetical protein